MVYNNPNSVFENKRKGIEIAFSERIIPTPTENIIIQYQDFGIFVKEYFQEGRNLQFPKPEWCLFCDAIGTCLVGWGFYCRWACDGNQRYWILIKVFKCKRQVSGGYLFIHPTFLLPYKQSTFSTVYAVLKQVVVQKISMQVSLASYFKEEVLLSYQNVQHWMRDLHQTASRWIAILQKEGGFILARPAQKGLKYPVELVHLMLVLEKYLEGQPKDPSGPVLPAVLLNRYRGSPLSTFNW